MSIEPNRARRASTDPRFRLQREREAKAKKVAELKSTAAATSWWFGILLPISLGLTYLHKGRK